MSDHDDGANARLGTPQHRRDRALNAAHLLELTEEFFNQAGKDVHRELADFFAARVEHPVAAPNGFTDALGLTALAIRPGEAEAA